VNSVTRTVLTVAEHSMLRLLSASPWWPFKRESELIAALITKGLVEWHGERAVLTPSGRGWLRSNP